MAMFTNFYEDEGLHTAARGVADKERVLVDMALMLQSLRQVVLEWVKRVPKHLQKKGIWSTRGGAFSPFYLPVLLVTCYNSPR